MHLSRTRCRGVTARPADPGAGRGRGPQRVSRSGESASEAQKSAANADPPCLDAGAGHFGPLIPVIDAAVRQRHDVLVVGPPTLDARGYPFGRANGHRTSCSDRSGQGCRCSRRGQCDVVVVGIIFTQLNVKAMLPTLRAAIEEWRPDVVVREPGEFADRGVAVPDVLPGLERPGAPSGRAVPRSGCGGTDAAAPGLVAGRLSPARVREL